MKGLIVLLGIFVILFGYMQQCRAFPAWPVPEDRIGIHDDNTEEFGDTFKAEPPIIEYYVKDNNNDWTPFPDKLTNKARNPHTVQILFDTNTNAGNRNLILGVNSDAPDQKLSIYFDGRHVGEELIQTGTLAEPFPLHTFWLGEIEKGPHTITIVNQSSPNPDTAYGIFFDFLQLVSPTPKTITIPDDYPTITDGIREAVPGDTVYVKKDIYKEAAKLWVTMSTAEQRSWLSSHSDSNYADAFSTNSSDQDEKPLERELDAAKRMYKHGGSGVLELLDAFIASKKQLSASIQKVERL